MTIPDGGLCLYLTFQEGLQKVDINAGVPAAANQADGAPLRFMGSVGGAEELENLLGAADVDHLQVTRDDAAFGSESTAEAGSPKSIVKFLKEKLAKPGAPTWEAVYASSVPSAQGLDRVASWFKKRDGENRARSAGR
jgi:hypothetical protein